MLLTRIRMQNWEKRWKVIRWVATLIAGIGLFESFIVSTHHLGAHDWPDHARFHALIGGLYLLVLNVVSLLITWGPLRNGSTLSRMVFAFIMLSIPACVVLAAAIIPGGSPPPLDYYLSLLGVAAGVGLTISCIWPLHAL